MPSHLPSQAFAKHAFEQKGAFAAVLCRLRDTPSRTFLEHGDQACLPTQVAFAKTGAGAFAIWLRMPSLVHKTVRIAFGL